MRTHIEFRSAKFPAYDGEADEVNPGRWGKRLAEYLVVKLREQGVPTGTIYTEDWGWGIPIEGKPCKMWVGCGNYDAYPDGFLCFIEPGKPVIRKLFRTIDITQDILFIGETIDVILHADPEINSMRWWSTEEAGG